MSGALSEDILDVVDSGVISLDICKEVIALEQLGVFPLSLFFHVDKGFDLSFCPEQVVCDLHAVVVVWRIVSLLHVHVAEETLAVCSPGDVGNSSIHSLHDCSVLDLVIVENLRLPINNRPSISSFINEVFLTFLNFGEVNNCLGPAHLGQVSRLIVLVGEHESVLVDGRAHLRDEARPIRTLAHVNAPVVLESGVELAFFDDLQVASTFHLDVGTVCDASVFELEVPMFATPVLCTIVREVSLCALVESLGHGHNRQR